MEIRGAKYADYITKLRCLVPRGKLNIIIDGQFGSTGKGLVSSYLGLYNRVDIAVTNASTNAGHTFYVGNTKYVCKHLPVVGVMNPNSKIYLCAGAIINPKLLMEEIGHFQVDPSRVYIHPRAAVIEDEDLQFEQVGAMKKIASTQSGVGAALMRKIERSSGLAQGHTLLRPFCKEFNLQAEMDKGASVVMEVPQGFDLSINSGLAYPYCTSREITVPSALADAQVHPSYLGKVICVIRTYPIRVGHLVEDGKIVGESGPFYKDSKEISFEDLGVPEEFTTNTKRVRRIATFSTIQYGKMLNAFIPDYIFLNFANYLSEAKLAGLLCYLPEVTHLCYGPKTEDIELNEFNANR